MAARLLSCPSAISSPTLGPGGPASRLPGSSKARSLPWSLPSSGLSLLPLVQLTSLLPPSGLTSPSCAASPTPLWEHRRASCTLPQNSLLRFTCAARSVSEVGEESGGSGSQLGSARNPDQFPALSHGAAVLYKVWAEKIPSRSVCQTPLREGTRRESEHASRRPQPSCTGPGEMPTGEPRGRDVALLDGTHLQPTLPSAHPGH